jgi:formate/nitrite transporter FocA (FNT family)
VGDPPAGDRGRAEALERSTGGLILSGLSAGLDIGFGLLLIAVTRTQVEGELPEPIVELIVANMYSIGFLFVVLGRSELFTEQTTLAVLPVLGGRARVGDLARLWGLVYVANMAGAAAFAGLAVVIGPALGIIDPPVFGRIAHRYVVHPGPVILLSGILAGWLMGLLSWLVAAARDTISQIAIVWLIATAIGYAHLHHVVVGAVAVLAGVYSGGTTPGELGHFLLWATLGNALGGSLFALMKYSHSAQEKPLEPSGG